MKLYHVVRSTKQTPIEPLMNNIEKRKLQSYISIHETYAHTMNPIDMSILIREYYTQLKEKEKIRIEKK